MEDKDLGHKKINNEQELNEGFSGENLPGNYNPAKLKTEIETDQYGAKHTVERARTTDVPIGERPDGDSRQPSAEAADTENAGPKAVEHKDRNSDVATNRYPNAHPDNRVNRGNIELED